MFGKRELALPLAIAAAALIWCGGNLVAPANSEAAESLALPSVTSGVDAVSDNMKEMAPPRRYHRPPPPPPPPPQRRGYGPGHHGPHHPPPPPPPPPNRRGYGPGHHGPHHPPPPPPPQQRRR